MNIKKLLTLSFVMLMLVAGAAVVGAQDDPPPPAEDGFMPGLGFDGERRGGPRERFMNRDFNIDRAQIEALVETYTGLPDDELREALRDGATLGELIEANGASVDDFVAEAAAPIYERIDEAVAEGNLTEENAAQLQERVTERLTQMTENMPRQRRGGPLAGRLGNMLDGELVETYTGLTLEEAAEALRDGATIAELIEANGASVDDFIAEAVVQAEAAIDERANARKARLEEVITALVNGERPNISPPIAESGE